MKTESELGGNAEKLAETTSSDVILDIHGVPIDPIWAAEFRGFFWGEGSLGVYLHQPHARGNPDHEYVGYSYQIIATIVQRSDNPILRAIHARLGGDLKVRVGFYVAVKDASHRTTTVWRTAKYPECERVGRLLQSSTALPFRKNGQVALWQEANLIRATKKVGRGTPYTAAEAKRMREISDELKRLKDYDG